MSTQKRNTYAAIRKLSLEQALSHLVVAREYATAESENDPHGSYAARDALDQLESHIVNLSLQAYNAPAAAPAPASTTPAQPAAKAPAETATAQPAAQPPAAKAPAETETAADELKMFCGFYVLDTDGRAANGLPRAILDTNGEIAYLRQQFGDNWWSVRDPEAQSGYRRLIGFDALELRDVAARRHRSLHEPASREAMDRRSFITPLAEEAVKAGIDPKRFDAALDIVTAGQLERAVTKYGASIDGCNCPDAQHREGKCKHQVAWILALRLDWDSTIVGEVARWLRTAQEVA